MVYPPAARQPCRRHWLKALEGLLQKHNGLHQRHLRRDFWWIYQADRPEQAERCGLYFCRRWAGSEPNFVHAFWQGFDAPVTFLKTGLRTWSYRLKTTNLAEGFFRNLRRFLGRFPGFLGPDQCDRAFGLYLLGEEMN
jgi:transposase-like protein